MKVTDVKVFKVFGGWRNWVFVKVETDAGVHGWGEATLEGKELAVEGALLDAARYLDGADPLNIAGVMREAYRDPFWRGGVVLNTALSALEIALWDIKGKVLDRPVWDLLGGRVNERVRVYGNGWYFGARTIDDFARRAKATADLGYTALKWDPFGRADEMITRDEVDWAVANVKAVREAVGPKVDLLVEVHGRLNVANAIRMADLLQPFDIFWYEEPIPPENIDALRKVSSKTHVPIATGERLYRRYDFRNVLEQQTADVLQPDICHAGGILETRYIAAMAEAYYVSVAPHNPNGPVCTAATLQVAATSPNFLILEYLMNDPDWRHDLYRPLLTVDEGYMRVPDGPGIGIELDEAELAKYPYRPLDLNFFSAKSVLEQNVARKGDGQP